MNTDVMSVRAAQTLASQRSITTSRGPERAADIRGEAVLDLLRDGRRHFRRRSRALARLAAGPELEISVGAVDAELHGRRVDELLEAVAELVGDGVPSVPRLDHGGNALPGDDLVGR